jgi:hypothetical protein
VKIHEIFYPKQCSPRQKFLTMKGVSGGRAENSDQKKIIFSHLFSNHAKSFGRTIFSRGDRWGVAGSHSNSTTSKSAPHVIFPAQLCGKYTANSPPLPRMPIFFNPKTLTGILMGEPYGKKFRVPFFFFFWKKILGTGIYRENFSSAARPIKTLISILMGGADDVLERGG